MDASGDASNTASPLQTGHLRGVHHLALPTEDMKMTTEFYVDVLGMKLVHAMKVPDGVGTKYNRGNPPWERLRHYFFDMGGDSLWAFFEIPKGEKGQSDRDNIGGMQHVAFSVSEAEFGPLQERLKAHHIDIDGPVEILPGLFSFYFYDPNGIRLEACCSPSDGAYQKVIDSVIQTRDVAKEELRTMTDDEAWLDRMTVGLE